MKYFIIFIFTLCVISFQVAHSIIIHDLKVPHMVIIGDNDNDDNDASNEKDDDGDDETIKLDCLYELEEDNPTSLVVKWYMNNNLIYQWIRDQQPSVTPYFREHIDEIEPTSTNPNHKYRGFTLKDLSIELDGVYKCLVQTENDSKYREEELNIIDISNYTIYFNDVQVQNETHLECSVSNIYPEPRIHFDADDEKLLYTTAANITLLDNGFYEAAMRAVVQNVDEDEDKFQCFITFDGLPYNITANAISGTDYILKSSSGTLLFTTLLLSVLFVSSQL